MSIGINLGDDYNCHDDDSGYSIQPRMFFEVIEEMKIGKYLVVLVKYYDKPKEILIYKGIDNTNSLIKFKEPILNCTLPGIASPIAIFAATEESLVLIEKMCVD